MDEEDDLLMQSGGESEDEDGAGAANDVKEEEDGAPGADDVDAAKKVKDKKTQEEKMANNIWRMQIRFLKLVFCKQQAECKDCQGGRPGCSGESRQAGQHSGCSGNSIGDSRQCNSSLGGCWRYARGCCSTRT